MGQPYSTNKTKLKKQEQLSIEEITTISTCPTIQKPEIVIVKKIPRYNVPKLLKLKANIDVKSARMWKKNHQRSQRLKYTGSYLKY